MILALGTIMKTKKYFFESWRIGIHCLEYVRGCSTTKVKRNFLIPLEGKSGEIREIDDSEEIQLVFLSDPETNFFSSEQAIVL